MRFVKFCLFFMVVVAIQVILPYKSYAQSEEYSAWSGGAKFESEVILNNYRNHERCYGVVQSVIVAEADLEACVYGSYGQNRVAVYEERGSSMAAISFPYESSFSKTSACTGEKYCMYSPLGDYLFSSSDSGVTRMNSFMRDIKSSDPPSIRYRYYDIYNTADYITGSTSYLFPIALSPDGSWFAYGSVYGYYLKYSIEYNFTMPILTDSLDAVGGRGRLVISNSGVEVLAFNEGELPRLFYTNCAIVKDLSDPAIRSEARVYNDCHKDYYLELLEDYTIDFTKAVFSSDSKKLYIYGDNESSGLTHMITLSVHVGGDYNRPTVSYLAMGDSFTSGEGEADDRMYKLRTNTKYEKCHLSHRSYPYLIGQAWGVKNSSVACSGAVMNDIFGSGDYYGQGGRLGPGKLDLDKFQIDEYKEEALSDGVPGRVRQTDFIEYLSPEMVSVGVGGNDLGLMSKLNSCLSIGDCDWVSDDGKVKTHKEILTLKQSYKALFSGLKNKYPGITFVSIGYPKPASDDPKCPLVEGVMLSRNEVIYLNETVSYINLVMKQSAVEAGVVYFDSTDTYGPNKLCQKTKTPAMNGLRIGDDIGFKWANFIGNESFHPTPYGHNLLASAFIRKYGSFNIFLNDSHYLNQVLGGRVLSRVTDHYDASFANSGVDNNVAAYWQGTEPSADTPDYVYYQDLVSLSVDGKKLIFNIPADVFDSSTPALFVDSKEHKISEGWLDNGSFEFDIFDLKGEPGGYVTVRLTGTSRGGKSLELYSGLWIPQNQTELTQFNDLSRVGPNLATTFDDGLATGSTQSLLFSVLGFTAKGEAKDEDHDEYLSYSNPNNRSDYLSKYLILSAVLVLVFVVSVHLLVKKV